MTSPEISQMFGEVQCYLFLVSIPALALLSPLLFLLILPLSSHIPPSSLSRPSLLSFLLSLSPLSHPFLCAVISLLSLFLSKACRCVVCGCVAKYGQPLEGQFGGVGSWESNTYEGFVTSMCSLSLLSPLSLLSFLCSSSSLCNFSPLPLLSSALSSSSFSLLSPLLSLTSLHRLPRTSLRSTPLSPFILSKQVL